MNVVRYLRENDDEQEDWGFAESGEDMEEAGRSGGNSGNLYTPEPEGRGKRSSETSLIYDGLYYTYATSRRASR